jgi:hypothetical protein
MVDAILQLTDKEKQELLVHIQKIFYTDDGRLGGEDGGTTSSLNVRSVARFCTTGCYGDTVSIAALNYH